MMNILEMIAEELEDYGFTHQHIPNHGFTYIYASGIKSIVFIIHIDNNFLLIDDYYRIDLSDPNIDVVKEIIKWVNDSE